MEEVKLKTKKYLSNEKSIVVISIYFVLYIL